MGHQEQVPFKQRESQLPDKKTACTNHLFPGTSSLATKFNISLGHADVSNVSTTFTTHHLRHATDIIIIHQSFFINPHGPTWLIPEYPGSTCSGWKELLQNLTAWPEQNSACRRVCCWEGGVWNPPESSCFPWKIETTWQPKPRKQVTAQSPKKTRNI